MMFDILTIPKVVASQVIRAWETKNSIIRKLLIIASISLCLSIITIIIGSLFFPIKSSPKENEIVIIIFGSLLAIAFLLYSVAIGYIENKDREKKEEKIIEKEIQVIKNPDKPQLAWDLARNKLENYLRENLSQVQSIFLLSVISMLVGFGLIIYGAIMVFEAPKNFQPAIVVAISGMIVNFIGASFLLLYKSTMNQAKEYVSVLERINAVGMSVQIIDTIEDKEAKIKDEVKAELAKKLIELYNKT